ncbi:hypothetical protein IGB42_04269 [Andreprevotia sp. IGB-42]|nr:hypothetical protein IGB42_04269 [Andreprevotia sp. IGB-42]
MRQQPRSKVRSEGFTTAQRLQVRLARPTAIEQQAPARWRGLHHSHPMLGNGTGQQCWIGIVLARAEYQPGTDGERQIDFQTGNIERQRRQCQHYIACIQPRGLGHAAQEVDDATMFHHHTLGAARGAGGVNHIGEVRRLPAGVQAGLRQCGERIGLLRRAEYRQVVCKHTQQMRLREYKRGPGVGQHVG